MALSDLINLSVVVSASAPSLSGFGVPLIAAYHTHYGDRVRSYAGSAAGLQQMIGDGFTVNDPAYVAANVLVSQTPHPPNFLVGRRANAYSQAVNLTCTDAVQGDVYQFGVGLPGSVPTPFSYTVPSGASTTTVAAAIGLLIEGMGPVTKAGTSPPTITISGTPSVAGTFIIAITTGGSSGTAVFKWSSNGGASYTTNVTTGSAITIDGVVVDFVSGTYATDNVYTFTTTLPFANLTVTPSSAVVELAMSSGTLINVEPDVNHMSVADATTDPGIVADLVAIAAANNTWYALTLDSMSSAEVQAAAGWVESNQKVFLANNSDTANGSTVATDTTSLLYHLKNSSYTRTGAIFAQSELLCYSGLALMATRLTAVPGSDNWAYKGPLATVPVDNPSESVYLNVLAKNGNLYQTVANSDFVVMGTAGAGTYFDTVRGLDAFENDMQVSLLAALLANAKIPYTDAGMTTLQSVMLGSLDRYVKTGLFSSQPAPTVTIPPVATQNLSNVAIRNVPGITFQASLAGAVNTLVINGTVVLS